MAISLSRPRTVDLIAWALLALALLFSVYVRVRLREFPLERDEGEFAYAGQLILHGVPPYKLAYNMKLPGTYVAYAALMAIFGQTTPGIHLGLLAVNLATIVLLYRLMREQFDPFSAGMAAVVFSILSISQSVLGMAAHATHFVAFFGLAGCYMLWRHLQSSRLPQAIASGLLFGTAFTMKQQGVFLMVFGAGFLLLLGLRLPSYPRRKLPLALGLYSLAAVLPYALTCLWLWRAGVWPKFWFWTVQYASKYVQNVPLSLASASLYQNGGYIVEPNWPLMLMALAGIVGVVLLRPDPDRPGVRAFAFGFLAFSFLCVCPGFYFRTHYFIAMLPAVAAFAGVGCQLLWEVAGGRFWNRSKTYSPLPYTAEGQGVNEDVMRSRTASGAGSKNRRTARKPSNTQQPAKAPAFNPLPALAAIVLFAGVCYTLYLQSPFLFVLSPLQACRLTYWGNPFLEAPVVAEYLRKHSTPDQTIAVLGSEPEIFFDAHRNSATGYIYTYGLMEPQPLAGKMQDEMIQEIEAAQPEFIVLTNIGFSWLPQNNERRIFDWVGNNLFGNNSRYRQVGIVDILSPSQTDYRWDDAITDYKVPTNRPEFGIFAKLPHLMIFQKKPRS